MRNILTRNNPELMVSTDVHESIPPFIQDLSRLDPAPYIEVNEKSLHEIARDAGFNGEMSMLVSAVDDCMVFKVGHIDDKKQVRYSVLAVPDSSLATKDSAEEVIHKSLISTLGELAHSIHGNNYKNCGTIDKAQKKKQRVKAIAASCGAYIGCSGMMNSLLVLTAPQGPKTLQIMSALAVGGYAAYETHGAMRSKKQNEESKKYPKLVSFKVSE